MYNPEDSTPSCINGYQWTASEGWWNAEEGGGREEGREGGREEEKVNRNGMATISYTPSRCMLSSG